jgi:DNA-binding response OmpR family regulator
MKSTILIVDDELSIRKLLSYYLGKKYIVITHSDGIEAMNWLLSGNKPDAIIADIEMPVISGMDLLFNIRAEKNLNKIPVIMISGREKKSDKIECFGLGADDYFVKPFNPHEMEAKIVTLLKKYKAVYN